MFDYIIQKIIKSKVKKSPFNHYYIENLFNIKHFSEIIKSKEINISPKKNHSALFDSLFEEGYKIIGFPGCITNQKKYIDWLKNKRNKKLQHIHSACEGFGMTLRLYRPKSDILIKLNNFLSSKKFNSTIAKKFNIKISDTTLDNGIQKYLDGYEISPHPDFRKKAATFMVNINPHKNSEKLTHHTHYLKIKKKFDYVTNFWNNNNDVQRCWIPWDWCKTNFVQSKNNSIVIFSPSDFSLHGVKAKYNHLAGQRTQLYGNLWYKKEKKLQMIQWEGLDLKSKNINNKPTLKENIFNFLTPIIKKKFNKNQNKVVNDRFKNTN